MSKHIWEVNQISKSTKIELLYAYGVAKRFVKFKDIEKTAAMWFIERIRQSGHRKDARTAFIMARKTTIEKYDLAELFDKLVGDISHISCEVCRATGAKYVQENTTCRSEYVCIRCAALARLRGVADIVSFESL